MKLKILSLICTLGFFALGTNVVAQEGKLEAPTAPTENMKAPSMESKKPVVDLESPNKTKGVAIRGDMIVGDNSYFCGDQNPYCNKSNPQYNQIKCAAICAIYTKAHGFVVNHLCSDPAAASATTKSQSCKTLCTTPTPTPPPTLNDLSCCITQVGNDLSIFTKAKLATTCEGGFNAQTCSFLPVANYAGWLCCPRDQEYITNCLAAAGQTPPLSCSASFVPQNCPSLTK